MARRAVHDYASDLGFNGTALAEIDIVVQEIGTNAARYATDGGWIHFTVPLCSAPGLELIYWDKGPGIYDLDRAIRDGVSTSGSLGAGLGAIRRLMDEFDVYSTLRATGRLTVSGTRRTTHGTALLVRKWINDESARAEVTKMRQRIGAWSRPHRGESVNGDAYFIGHHKKRTLFAVIDGLGHGAGAKQATDVALASLEDWMGEPLEEVIHAIHDGLRATRGAVMGAVIIDHAEQRFYYAGVGNVEVRVFNALEPITSIPANGTLGARLGRVRVWTHAWKEGAILIMASDGLSASWDMASYPGLLRRSPQLVASILMRDYARTTDDATVLVVR